MFYVQDAPIRIESGKGWGEKHDNMHQSKASAYYVNTRTALKSVGSKLLLHVYVCHMMAKSYITSNKTGKTFHRKDSSNGPK
jgi:hypothetical protein